MNQVQKRQLAIWLPRITSWFFLLIAGVISFTIWFLPKEDARLFGIYALISIIGFWITDIEYRRRKEGS